MAGATGGGGGLMSCVREASLEPPAPYRATHQSQERNGEGRKGRFLRGLRRMFRRRPADHSPDNKSRSTSELLQDLRHRSNEGAYSSGLSVSHDSVFTGDRSGDESSDQAQSGHRAELVAAVRRRGRGDQSDDDEDLGLPHSPPASPPTDKADKRHHAAISASSCSDGSLLSVGSSEMDEDSSGHQHDASTRSDLSEYTMEPPSGVAPLSHSAARHKMAVRPRRTHGAPRRKKTAPMVAPVLPITPELNEEMMRSATPETKRTAEVVTESFSSTTTKEGVTTELRCETPPDVRLKSSSLPPGLALGHLLGHSPRLTLPDQVSDTPRSSVKRSKSSTHGKSLRDESPPPKMTSSETHIHASRTDERASRCDERANRYAGKKSERVDKKEEKKKDESFFSRLLLRRSKKDPKAKKEDDKKEKTRSADKEKMLSPHYKPVDRESHEYGKIQLRTQSAERTNQDTYKTSTQMSAGLKVFASQSHKRMDQKGAYIQDFSIAKSVDYGTNDLKIAEETDKMLNMDLKYSYKLDKRLKDDFKDSFNMHTPPERTKRLVDPYKYREQDTRHFSPTMIADEAPVPVPRRPNDFAFNSGSVPVNIPYFSQHLKLSSSASPPKSVFPGENTKKLHRSTEFPSGFVNKETDEDFVPVYPMTQQEKDYATELRSLGEEYIEPRISIGKSQSFRHASETTSISSHDQMPSLPLVGQSLMESWEANYLRNVSDNKRHSARNYHILSQDQYDSLPSTDSSYLDSLKDPQLDSKSLFINGSNLNETRKRDSEISQIEANIDNIISSPKPLITAVLKSGSLDSVKSTPEKKFEDRRKTIAVESTALLGHKSDSEEKENFEVPKSEPEMYISITHLNKEMVAESKLAEQTKLSKSQEKVQNNAFGVPEFMKIQLNKVDSKPATNVVLTANVTPKRPEPPPPQENKTKEDEIERETNESPLQVYLRKTGSQSLLNRSLEFLGEDSSKLAEKPIVPVRNSPINVRKSAPPSSIQAPTTPKLLLKKKITAIDEPKFEKSRANSLCADEKDNISFDQKSFGSKSSLQSSDSNEARTPERSDDGVVYRRKPISVPKEQRNGSINDDEPELMKVFARRSLKLKDSEADLLAQEIAVSKDTHDMTKILKNESNSSIKSRDSDKENDDNQENTDIKIIDLDINKKINDIVPNIQSRLSHFGVSQYQRSISVSVTNVANTKRVSAPAQMRNEVSKYRKEISDATPEKRLRNRTFPDSSNECAKTETIPKRPWLTKENEGSEKSSSTEKDFTEKDGSESETALDTEAGSSETDESPQFKSMLQMRAEWEMRAKRGMTK